MSEPADPLPQRADIPVQRLPRTAKTVKHSQRKSPPIETAAGTGHQAQHGASTISRPLPAVTRVRISPLPTAQQPNLSQDIPPALLRGGDSLIGAPRSHPAESLQEGDRDAELHGQAGQSDSRRHRFRIGFGKPGPKDPYAPSGWNKFNGNAKASGYTTKIFVYRSIKILWHSPEHTVRAWRKVTTQKKYPALSGLPNPARADQSALERRGPSRINRAWVLMKKPEYFLIVGMLLTLAMNGAFAYWVWVHVQVFLDPHTWRGNKYVTSSLAKWTSFVSLEIWISVMLGAYNIMGGFLIISGLSSIYHLTIGKLLKIKAKGTTRTAQSYLPAASRRAIRKGSNGLIYSIGLITLILMVGPLIACVASPPRLRWAKYPSRCSGGEWDFRVVLDGRIDPLNLTKGKVEIWDMSTQEITALFLTEKYVDTTWLKTEAYMVIKRDMREGHQQGEFVSEVAYRFPYIPTPYEDGSWATLSDIPRARNGNYTATLKDISRNATRDISGEFPYLDDESGLRLDSLGLIPDVRRSWKSMAYGSENCPWGPDAKLLENTDVSARDLVGEGHIVLQTDMTKWGRCAELTVCANRRKQEISGLDYIRGEDGKRLLDELLVVPLGILLAEQVRFGSCCGDGFTPTYTSTSP